MKKVATEKDSGFYAVYLHADFSHLRNADTKDYLQERRKIVVKVVKEFKRQMKSVLKERGVKIPIRRDAIFACILFRAKKGLLKKIKALAIVESAMYRTKAPQYLIKA